MSLMNCNVDNSKNAMSISSILLVNPGRKTFVTAVFVFIASVVGDDVGLVDGAPDGVRDGRSEGAILGATDGVMLGISLGATESDGD